MGKSLIKFRKIYNLKGVKRIMGNNKDYVSL